MYNFAHSIKIFQFRFVGFLKTDNVQMGAIHLTLQMLRSI